MTAMKIIPVAEVEGGLNALVERIRTVPSFATLRDDQVFCLASAELVEAEPVSVLAWQNDTAEYFYILLEGLITLRQDVNGERILYASIPAPATFGEVPLLAGTANRVTAEVTETSTLLRLNTEAFWQLMTVCPTIRQAILATMAQRLQFLQSAMLEREKMNTLGTLTAGLMHELNNPGAAAKSSAARLRESLVLLQQISLRFCSSPPASAAQSSCLLELMEQAFRGERPALDSLEESDRIDELTDWLKRQNVENAARLAPSFVGAGITIDDLQCAQGAFSGPMLCDSLNWLNALTSSLQYVATIEDSVSRVSELVMAVKKHSNFGAGSKTIDVQDSIHSTFVMLRHKVREKEISVEKHFYPDLPKLESKGQGLGQVWTNLLDNAIDAAPAKGKITITTRLEGENIAVDISDDGEGIPPEIQKRIFEPFFTTKPIGKGTGLGLDLVSRIVTGQFGGKVTFTSLPGKTTFSVLLPLARVPTPEATQDATQSFREPATTLPKV